MGTTSDKWTAAIAQNDVITIAMAQNDEMTIAFLQNGPRKRTLKTHLEIEEHRKKNICRQGHYGKMWTQNGTFATAWGQCSRKGILCIMFLKQRGH